MVARRFWTDEQLCGFLQSAAAAEGQPLRYASYRAWAAQHEDRPSPDTIVRCLGPWVIALARAGLQVDRRRGVYRLAQTEPPTDDAAPDAED